MPPGAQSRIHTAIVAAVLEQEQQQQALATHSSVGSSYPWQCTAPSLTRVQEGCVRLKALSTALQGSSGIRPGAVCLSYSKSQSWIYNCRITSHGRRAVVCEKGASCQASNVSIHCPFTGVYLQTGSKLQASSVDINHAMSHAVEMYQGCSAYLRKSSISECTGSAVFAFESGTVFAEASYFISCLGLSMQEQSRRMLALQDLSRTSPHGSRYAHNT
ncbi:hypothetical protein DUNSADRAFT_9558 [Dunaliella salina]|uniref:Right handed beta helix domain-containing protein n=1 Tax=Dunaliella salina TaxID=3046 RepID=A0ABQ7GH67_DUNSA|nr:hypothetical protein DUNSADRAFT_9558 [Dunaliella salina]|eukprot:KAF5833946.1 hypothetical protein DUNSADRAFT_9558 [Dunaliella salina]